MSTLTGAEVIARSLKAQGVTVIFGIVGIPVVEVADAAISAGIRFIGFRNEQSASYAASAWGYLSGQPGVCLVVGGPGVVHAMAGFVNAQVNCWPMLLLAGSSDTHERGNGAFQDMDQLAMTEPHAKFCTRPSSIGDIPKAIEKAIQLSLLGRPGACYVDLPADIIQGREKGIDIRPTRIYAPNRTRALEEDIHAACTALQGAKRPLLIIGKGAAYARAEMEIRGLVEALGTPFLTTPMGKGVVSDEHPLCVSGARSSALETADVILILGARLNWILHFGNRFDGQAKVIRVDIAPEEKVDGARSGREEIFLLGDIRAVVENILRAISLPKSSFPLGHDFSRTLAEVVRKNKSKLQAKMDTITDPLSYHCTFHAVSTTIPEDSVIVSEGANTLDIARSILDMREPRARLDSGTFATMGVGMGFAIAAQLYYPDRPIVGVVGDSAFGFSAMEIETATRWNLPILILVINNGGIYHGLTEEEYTEQAPEKRPSTSLTVGTRYDQLAISLGGVGEEVRDIPALKAGIERWKVLRASGKGRLTLLNVIIEPGKSRKVAFNWMSSGKGSKL